ncbi:acetone carboxylase [Rothia sp. LK2588]|uniref:acetone carboxylase n=1 Tax=Rothia sp. LK2588 TaxID=3114369 RepID=UPI0034CD5D72
MDLLNSLGNQPPEAPERQCSRKGCRAQASFQLLWNNPRIHTEDRRKVWLACPDHVQYLQDFLGARGFLKETKNFDGADEGQDV